MTNHRDSTVSGTTMDEKGLSRRDLIKGAGGGITVGMLAAAFGGLLPEGVDAAQSAGNADAMTILYPAGPDIRFDADYYRDHHLKTIMKLYGKSIERFELRKVPASPAGAPPAAWSAAINIWIADMEAFNANNAKHGPTLVEDVKNFTNTQPTIQVDKVHGSMGKARNAAKVGDTCLTILYPNSEGVRWDVDYYAGRQAGKEGHMALIYRLYGPKAISRFELRKGESGQAPGTKAAFVGSIGIYIENQAAFDAAGSAHGATLVADVPNFSSVNPTAFPTVIHGIG